MRKHRLDRRQRKKRRKIIIFSMAGIVCLFSVGYATFSQTFLVSGKGTVVEKTITIDELKEKKVTSGDGLYEDIYEEGRYIYRGANPSNYISFNDEIWRIIAIENDNTLKIMRNESVGDMAFDTNGFRTTGYCSQGTILDYGCNAWQVTNSFTSANMSGLVENDAELNTYLNGIYYNSLNEIARSQISVGTFDVGPILDNDVYINNTPLSTIIMQEKAYEWKGKIALPTVSEYVKSSNNSACTSAYDYSNGNEIYCYGNSETHNWMFNMVTTATNKWVWLLTPTARSNDVCRVFDVYSDGALNYVRANYTLGGVVPVLYLNSNIKLTGEGIQENPYRVSLE